VSTVLVWWWLCFFEVVEPTNPRPTNPQAHKPTNPQTHDPQTHKPTNPQTHKPGNPQIPSSPTTTVTAETNSESILWTLLDTGLCSIPFYRQYIHCWRRVVVHHTLPSCPFPQRGFMANHQLQQILPHLSVYLDDPPWFMFRYVQLYFYLTFTRHCCLKKNLKGSVEVKEGVRNISVQQINLQWKMLISLVILMFMACYNSHFTTAI
jgi:hypothetical protein